MFRVSVTTEKPTAVPEASQRNLTRTSPASDPSDLKEATGQVLPQCGKAAWEPGNIPGPCCVEPRPGRGRGRGLGDQQAQGSQDESMLILDFC